MKLNNRLFMGILSVLLTFPACTRDQALAPRKLDFGPSHPGVVKVVTFNIRYDAPDDGQNKWDLRKTAAFDLLADTKADVVALQEVLDTQLKALRKVLPQYEAISTGRDDGRSAGEACSILYRRDRFQLADSGTFWFSNTPWQPSTHWGNTLPRICTWVRLTEVSAPKSFYIYNLHLDHQSQPSRLQSVRLLAKEIANRPFKDPYVVCGDFNISLNNPAMLYLQKLGFDTPYARLTDVWQMTYPDKPAPGTYHAFTGRPQGDKIDHILVTEQTTVLHAEIDTRAYNEHYPSDHFPVIATLRLQ